MLLTSQRKPWDFRGSQDPTLILPFPPLPPPRVLEVASPARGRNLASQSSHLHTLQGTLATQLSFPIIHAGAAALESPKLLYVIPINSLVH